MGEYTLMLAVDFKAAFDKAWRMRFYQKLLDKGFPPQAVRWAKAFLTERRATVRCDGCHSSLRNIREGFPQGTVTGPLFWDVFVDDVVEALGRHLPKGSFETALYADDLTILLRGPCLSTLYQRGQQVLDNLSGWEVANKALVSLEKSTATVFTPKQRPLLPRQRPRLTYPDQSLDPPFRGHPRPLQYETNPRLLGLKYDEKLSFKSHVADTRARMSRRGATLGALSGTSWGCERDSLRSLHLSYVQSTADYAMAAYGPYAGTKLLGELETEQLFAACRVSGCTKDTRREVALMEANLQSIEQRLDYCSAMQYERCMRLPGSVKARQVAERQPPDPAPRRDWRQHARGMAARAELDRASREPVVMAAPTPPWRSEHSVDFRPRLCRPVTKKKNTNAEIREAALETLAQLPPADVTAYTDGSVLDPRRMRRGGGGYTLTDAKGKQFSGKCAAGARCNSYRAELSAMLLCLRDLLSGAKKHAVPQDAVITVALDSQSAIKALAAGPAAQSGRLEIRVWEALSEVCARFRARVIVQYVPGHVDVEEQEEVDKVAKAAAAECAQGDVPIALSLAKAAIKEVQRGELVASLRNKVSDHFWLAVTDGKPAKCDKLSREEQRTLAQLRAGHSPLTFDYLYRVATTTKNIKIPDDGDHGMSIAEGVVDAVRDGSPAHEAGVLPGWRPTHIGGKKCATDGELAAQLVVAQGDRCAVKFKTVPSPKCPACPAKQDGVRHLLAECPGYAKTRHSVFGTHNVPLSVLRDQQKEVLRYLQRIGRWRPKDSRVRGARQTGTHTQAYTPGPQATAAAASSTVGPRVPLPRWAK